MMGRSLSLKPITKAKSMGKQQCKKHPKHRQCPGVCSLCLSEKLSKISSNNNNSRSRAAMIKARARVYYHSSSSSSLSSSSYESSYASSKAASPLHEAARHRRIVSDLRTAKNKDQDNGRLFFSKSKSMAAENDKFKSFPDDKKMMKKKKNNVSKIWDNFFRFGRNDQKINASSSTTVVY